MKSINPELLDLLERYVADELSEKERIGFEAKLETEGEIVEALDFFMAFETEKEDFGQLLMKQELQKIDFEMEQEKVYQPITSIAEEILQQIANFTYKTIEEVNRWFQPIPEYQSLLLATTDRSDSNFNTLKAKMPIVGKDYTNDTLIFELNKTGNYLLTIENNRREIVLKRPFLKNEKKISVDVTGYPMGVYYWKVMDLSKDWMLVGDFLVTIKDK